MSSFEQLTQGWCVQYAVACARLTPCSAPWTTALASAWVARRQCSLTSVHPTSVQCATPRGAPLYPVVRMRCSRASTQPTDARGQVARVPTVCAICMKYSSQPGRMDVGKFRLRHLEARGQLANPPAQRVEPRA